MAVTVGELLDGAEAQIKASEAIELWRPYMARLEAASLLGFVIGHEPEDAEEAVPAAAHRRFDGLIARRVTGEPAALIIGTTLAGILASVPPSEKLKLGIDLSGGTILVYEAAKLPQGAPTAATLAATILS